jgi:hypothetical protein
MSFPQQEKPENEPPGGLAWPNWYAVGGLAGVVLFNVMAIPVSAVVFPYPGFGCLWWAQLGLTASWMTWSSSPALVRYAASVMAIVLCACSAHSLMAWENETLGMFLQFHMPVVFMMHLLLLPTRWLGWRWRFQPAKAATSERRCSLLHLMVVLTAWAAWLGYLRWDNGGAMLESVLVLARNLLFCTYRRPGCLAGDCQPSKVVARRRRGRAAFHCGVESNAPIWCSSPA